MKASLKFRDEQKPLLRAKVPLNILGMPFQSGVVCGDSKELTLNLATFFQTGPSIKLAYRPNDSTNPFSLTVKTGTGSFGSPFSSSMLMSCEFNLLPRIGNPNNGNPIFMLHFKPRFGDFSFKKSQSSILDKGFGNGAGSDDDGLIEVVDSPPSSFSAVKVLRGDGAGAIAGVFSGVDVVARTTVPVKGRAAVNFRWGVRVPAEMKCGGKTMGGFAFQKVPFLVMDKIGVEHVAECGDSKKKGKDGAGELGFPVGADVAEACLSVKRQLEVLQAENGLLRNAVEDLRREIAAGSGGGGLDFGKFREFERNGGKVKSFDSRKDEKKSMEANASEELKKVLK